MFIFYISCNFCFFANICASSEQVTCRFANWYHLIPVGITEECNFFNINNIYTVKSTASKKILVSLWQLCSTHLSQLLGGDVAVAVSVEDAEGLPDVVAALILPDLLGHHGKELLELDAAVAVHVNLVDHVLQLGLCRVLAQRTHHRGQLLQSNKGAGVKSRGSQPFRSVRPIFKTYPTHPTTHPEQLSYPLKKGSLRSL